MTSGLKTELVMSMKLNYYAIFHCGNIYLAGMQNSRFIYKKISDDI